MPQLGKTHDGVNHNNRKVIKGAAPNIKGGNIRTRNIGGGNIGGWNQTHSDTVYQMNNNSDISSLSSDLSHNTLRSQRFKRISNKAYL